MHAAGVTPQSQQVIVRYDTANLAVLDVTARLDDAVVALPREFHTPRAADATASAATLALETVAGERFEIPLNSVGTGSRQQTREAFATLTPDSQRRSCGRTSNGENASGAAGSRSSRRRISGRWSGTVPARWRTWMR